MVPPFAYDERLQGILREGADVLLALFKFLLRPPTLGYIGLDPQPIQGFPRPVSHQRGLVPDLDYPPVPGKLPVLYDRPRGLPRARVRPAPRDGPAPARTDAAWSRV